MAQWAGEQAPPKVVAGFRIDPQPLPQWKLRAVAKYIHQKKAKEAQRAAPRKSERTGEAECPEDLAGVAQEEQLLRQELADLYGARNRLLWLLRRSTEVEIQRNHDANMYPRGNQQRR